MGGGRLVLMEAGKAKAFIDDCAVGRGRNGELMPAVGSVD